jgi:hypothetical protein
MRISPIPFSALTHKKTKERPEWVGGVVSFALRREPLGTTRLLAQFLL